jgi:phage gp45-like
MVHRTTGLGAAFRGYVAGGARTLITSINDGSLMQSMGGSMMKGEQTGEKVEAPQNYGFTSVVADAVKDKEGKVTGSAEGFMSFPGGNRTFQYCGIMDDRRHRLMNLANDAAKGAAAMFGLKEWGQQFLNTEDGNFLTGNTQNKNRFALVDNQNGQKQQGQQQGSSGSAGQQKRIWKITNPPGAVELPDGRVVIRSRSGVEFEVEKFDAAVIEARDAGSGSGSGGNGGSSSAAGGGKPTGQKTLHKEESTIWMEQNKNSTTCAHGDAYSGQRTGQDSSVYYKDRHTSAQATDGHCHICSDDVHIWVADGCFSDMPIIVKKDGICKY